MDNRYNLYNLEASFKQYLLAGNIKPVSLKNYLSDFRHFAGWLSFYMQSRSEDIRFERLGMSAEGGGTHWSEKRGIELLLKPDIIEDYKSYLVSNNIPTKTINRRLSTVRRFCSFCISQGWLKENPAKGVENVRPISPISPISLIEKFRTDLEKENRDQQTITNQLEDVQEFIELGLAKP